MLSSSFEEKKEQFPIFQQAFIYFKDWLLFILCACVNVYTEVCEPPGAGLMCECQKKLLDPLELEGWVLVNHLI